MQKLATAIFMAAIGLVASVIAIVLIDYLGVVWFSVLLSLGLLLVLAGIVEFITHLRGSKALGGNGAQEEISPKYCKKSYVMSVPERNLYRLLQSILPNSRYDVFCQSALVSVIDKVTHTSYRNELFRIVDFCIVDAKTTEPLLLVELNDSSHMRVERQLRDKKVRDLCDKAGLRLVAFTMAEAVDEHFVSQTVRNHLR